MYDSSEDELTSDQTKSYSCLNLTKDQRQRNVNDLTMDEVENALSEIDLKYSKYNSQTECDKNLMMLLQDFDSLGLPEIDPSLPVEDINSKIVNNSKLLVEMYRRNLNKLDEDELSFRSKDTRYANLQKKLTNLNNSYEKLLYKNKSLEAVVDKMRKENSQMKDMLNMQRNEMKKLKQYYCSKQDELQHSVKKLEKNNQDLKDMFRQDIGKYIAKDEVIADYVKKCKHNEQIYESTIKQLQQNNTRLLEEITKFRE
ncbi:uncharacterized protein LOC123313660 [Coccinella septempunctata]|uniref:uncharacterized protein LOC123313660 n=1 Tax=Coccinella septempunctata TaxID=41139 RepID=UPI001D0877D0|nr:uncharacterized protein LOC123313660 [Coccinella septempunctata]